MAKKFPGPIPFNRGGGKELITIRNGKDPRTELLNLMGKSRYSIQDAVDTLILLTIGEEDPGTKDLVDTHSTLLIAQDGLGRTEEVMVRTQILAEKPLPRGVNDIDPGEDDREKPPGRMKRFLGGGNNGREKEELYDKV